MKLNRIATTPLLLLAILTAFSHANAGETTVEFTTETSTDGVYRPGSWMLIGTTISIPPDMGGAYTPELRLISQKENKPLFISRLEIMNFEEQRDYRLDFWIIPGTETPNVQLLLKGKNDIILKSKIKTNILKPLPPGRRLLISTVPAAPQNAQWAKLDPATIPVYPTLLESCDIVILGSINESDDYIFNESQINALCNWLATGGVTIILNNRYNSEIQEAASRLNLKPGQPTNFVLPTPKRPDERIAVPRAMRIGKGLVVDLSAAAGSEKAALGSAVWQRLNSELLPPPINDKRVNARRYKSLGNGWPKPPRIDHNTILRWLGAWTALCLASVIVPAIRRRPWLCALIVGGLSIVLGAALYRQYPQKETEVFTANIRLAGETGENGPTINEEIFFATPFRSDIEGRAKVTFSGFPPPKPLAWSEKEINSTIIELETNENGGCISAYNRDEQTHFIRRGRGIIFSRTKIGKNLPTIMPIFIEHKNGVTLQNSVTEANRLFNALLLTKRHKQASNEFNFTKSEKMERIRLNDLNLPRQKCMRMLCTEHDPGNFITLMGWEQPKKASKNSLGTLRIYGFSNIIIESNN